MQSHPHQEQYKEQASQKHVTKIDNLNQPSQMHCAQPPPFRECPR